MIRFIEAVAFGYSAFKKHLKKSDAELDGADLELMVRHDFITKKSFQILHYTPEFDANDYNKSLDKPDYQFSDNQTGFKFYVEVKARTDLGGFTYCSTGDKQLNRYRYYDRYCPVYLFLEVSYGLKFTYYFIPISKIRYAKLVLSYYSQYIVSSETDIKKILYKK